MPFAISNNNVGAHKYDSDEKGEVTISMRDAYEAASGIAKGTGANGDPPFGFHPRGVYIVATVNQKVKRRFVPVSKAKAASLVPGGDFGNVDGVLWKVAGYRGERRRTKRVNYGANQT